MLWRFAHADCSPWRTLALATAPAAVACVAVAALAILATLAVADAKARAGAVAARLDALHLQSRMPVTQTHIICYTYTVTQPL